MKRTTGNITTEVIEGIRISITAPRDEREKVLENRKKLLEGIEGFGGELVDEETTFETTTLMIKFSDYQQQNAWLRKMQLYGV